MKIYHAKVDKLTFTSLSAKVFALAVLSLLLSPIPVLVNRSLVSLSLADSLSPSFTKLAMNILAAGVALLLVAAIIKVMTPHTAQIVHMVRRGLFDPRRGNPLHLHEGEQLPRIRCKHVGAGLYDLTIGAEQSATVDTIRKAAPSLSSILNRRFRQYAVVATDLDTAFSGVTFRLDDVKADRSFACTSIEQMRPQSPTLLRVNKVSNIDLASSGSILIAGKTRSGKTTGIISLLLQALLSGPDNYGSRVVIIDPKQAELSRLPYTVTLDEDGEARAILDALKDFADTITHRQRVINDLSERSGDAVKWWDAGFHPSFAFIDEYVACRSLFPKKATKDDDYYLDAFDGLVKRIITMGASAGCFAIISIAEASVQEGGLPAMLRSAMSTRVLFRPTRAEGLLLWDKEKLDSLPDRVYGPGDAWFSSTDGVHEAVSYVHFPRMEFPVYRELGRLLQSYYDNR